MWCRKRCSLRRAEPSGAIRAAIAGSSSAHAGPAMISKRYHPAQRPARTRRRARPAPWKGFVVCSGTSVAATTPSHTDRHSSLGERRTASSSWLQDCPPSPAWQSTCYGSSSRRVKRPRAGCAAPGAVGLCGVLLRRGDEESKSRWNPGMVAPHLFDLPHLPTHQDGVAKRWSVHIGVSEKPVLAGIVLAPDFVFLQSAPPCPACAALSRRRFLCGRLRDKPAVQKRRRFTPNNG